MANAEKKVCRNLSFPSNSEAMRYVHALAELENLELVYMGPDKHSNGSSRTLLVIEGPSKEIEITLPQRVKEMNGHLPIDRE